MHIMNSTVQNEGKEVKDMSNEKIYRTISHSGGASLALGIVVLVTGIVSGVLMIVTGAKLLKQKYQITF